MRNTPAGMNARKIFIFALNQEIFSDFTFNFLSNDLITKRILEFYDLRNVSVRTSISILKNPQLVSMFMPLLV